MTRWTLSAALLAMILASARAAAPDEVQDAVVKSYELERSLKYTEAINALKGVRKANYLVEMRIGWLHYLNGNYSVSKQHYQTAMKSAPKAIEAQLGLTLPLLADAKYTEVESVTRAILKKDSNNYLASVRLAMALRLQGKYRPAREVNGAMLELYPTDVSFLVEQLLNSVAIKESDVNSLCERILMLDPENATAKYYAPAGATAKKSKDLD